jgi:hypothetical protein
LIINYYRFLNNYLSIILWKQNKDLVTICLRCCLIEKLTPFFSQFPFAFPGLYLFHVGQASIFTADGSANGDWDYPKHLDYTSYILCTNEYINLSTRARFGYQKSFSWPKQEQNWRENADIIMNVALPGTHTGGIYIRQWIYGMYLSWYIQHANTTIIFHIFFGILLPYRTNIAKWQSKIPNWNLALVCSIF